MNKFLLSFFLLFFSSTSLKVTAQTAAEYLAKSDILWSIGMYDLALKQAWLAEPLVADSTSRNSSKYGYYISQYFAMNHEALGNTDSAEYWYVAGMNMMATHNDTTSFDYGETLSNYGNLLNSISRYREAFQYMLKGEAIVSHFPDSVNSYLASINNLATSYNYFGDYANATALYLKCLAGIEQHPDKVTQLQKNSVIQNLAAMYIKSGDVVNAECYYRKLIDSQKKIGYKMGYFEAKKNLGSLYLTAKRRDSAEKIFTELYEDAELSQHNGKISRDPLATVYVEVINGLSFVKLLNGDPAGAELLCKQAIDISEKLADTRAFYSSRGGLAHLYKYTGRNKEADSVFEVIFKRPASFDQFTYLYVYLEYCENLVMLKQMEKAFEKIKFLSDTTFTYLYKNFPAMPEDQQMIYMQALNRHRNLLPSAFEGKGTDNAQNISYVHNRLLQLKGLILTYQQRKLQLQRQSPDTALVSLNEKWYASKINLYNAYSIGKKEITIDSLMQITNRYDKMISAKTGIPVENIYDTLTAKISSKLKWDEAAIEFVRYGIGDSTNRKYGVFIIRPGAPVRFIKLCSEKNLKQCFVKKNKKNFEAQYQLQNGQQLYHLIWRPINEYLKNTKTIYYTPDGLLNYLSFDALSPAKDVYVSTEKKLVQFFNLQKLLNNTEKKEGIRSASLWGGIDYKMDYSAKKKKVLKKKRLYDEIEEESLALKSGLSKLNSLANDEIRAIDSMMNQKKIPVTTYKNKKATEANFNKSSPTFKGLLHISSHGFYLPGTQQTSSAQALLDTFAKQRNPLLRSGLVLSDGQYPRVGRIGAKNPDDGILTAYEIALMDLSKVNLVVLSACETALGDIDPGSEGVLGLQRAFKLAGVDKMILTLWSVNTVATEQFMKQFYQVLLANNDPADALYKVKKEMAAKKIPPYAWAGFVLVE